MQEFRIFKELSIFNLILRSPQQAQGEDRHQKTQP